MFSKILVANRGEIARRVIATATRLGVKTVAVYSDADAGARHVGLADEAVHIGGSAPAESYLVQARVIEAAQRTGAEAIHPGYGFGQRMPGSASAARKTALSSSVRPRARSTSWDQSPQRSRPWNRLVFRCCPVITVTTRMRHCCLKPPTPWAIRCC